MKKNFIVLITFLFILDFITAEESFYVGNGGKNNTIMFAESSLENGVYDKSDIWITDKI